MSLGLAFLIRLGATVGLCYGLWIVLNKIAVVAGRISMKLLAKSFFMFLVGLVMFGVLFVAVSEFLHSKFGIPLELPF